MLLISLNPVTGINTRIIKRLQHPVALIVAGLFLGLTQHFSQFSPLCVLALMPVFLLLEDGNRPTGSLTKRLLLYGVSFTLTEAAWMVPFGVFKMIALGLCNGVLLFLFLVPAVLSHHQKGNLFLTHSSLVLGWLAYEIFQQQWTLAYPLISLGTSFGAYPNFIKWYSVTGSLGGTLWALACSALVAEGLLTYLNGKRLRKSFIWRWSAFVIVLPMLGLLSIGYQNVSNTGWVSVAVIHPNLDVRSTRLSMNGLQTSQYYADLVDHAIQNEAAPKWIFCPENALPDLGWKGSIQQNRFTSDISPLRETVSGTSATVFIGGFYYEDVTDRYTSEYSNHSPDRKHRYKAYNSIAGVTGEGAYLVHTKDRLVPFEEFLPGDRKVINFVQQLVPRVGATGFYLTPGAHLNQYGRNHSKIANLICYESLFSLETAARLRSHDPQLLAVHLNEGWYDNYVGANKFATHGVVRAIESSRSVIRSSNRGISSIIDPAGNTISRTDSKTNPSILYADLSLQTGPTIFVRFTSVALPYLVYTAWIATIFMLGLNARWYKRKPAGEKR